MARTRETPGDRHGVPLRAPHSWSDVDIRSPQSGADPPQAGLGGQDEPDAEYERLCAAEKELREKGHRHHRAVSAVDDVDARKRDVEQLQRVTHRHGDPRPEFTVKFGLNDDGTLGYQFPAGGNGVVDGFDKLADSLGLHEAGTKEWKIEMGRFVADAVVAHVRTGLEMAAKGDEDGLATMMHRLTSEDTAYLNRLADAVPRPGSMIRRDKAA